MRIEQGRTLPEQGLQRAAATRLAWLVVEFAAGLSRHAGPPEQHRGERRGQPQPDHAAHKGTTRDQAVSDLADQVPKLLLVHAPSPCFCLTELEPLSDADLRSVGHLPKNV